MTMILAIWLLAAAPYHPSEGGTIRREIPVNMGDLDCDNPADRVELDKRLRKAARNVCGTAFPLDGVATEDMQRCRREAFERATRQLMGSAAAGE